MIKIKNLLVSILCFLPLYNNLKFVEATDFELPNTTVYLTGAGIATRLHEPVLEEFSGVDIEFTRIPEKPSKADDSVIPYDGWLFLGTPVYKQEQHILICTKMFKKILCEKPVGLSTKEIKHIKSIINQNHVLFRVNYALRFLPCVEEIKEFIKNNDVKSVTITCNADFNKNPPNRAWKSDCKLGGGIVYSILPHMVDLLNYLNLSEDLDSIEFKSTTQIPMNDIELHSKTLNQVNTLININLCENFDELTLKIETSNESKTFDLINSSKNKIFGTRYSNGTLSATSEISPWRISFKHLLENLFTNPNDCRFAKIEDAESVHKVLDVILSQQKHSN